MDRPRPAKILIVEDDETVRSALQEMFERDGLNVEAVALASDALGSLPVINPDLVVLDLGMPVLDGRLHDAPVLAFYDQLRSGPCATAWNRCVK